MWRELGVLTCRSFRGSQDRAVASGALGRLPALPPARTSPCRSGQPPRVSSACYGKAAAWFFCCSPSTSTSVLSPVYPLASSDGPDRSRGASSAVQMRHRPRSEKKPAVRVKKTLGGHLKRVTNPLPLPAPCTASGFDRFRTLEPGWSSSRRVLNAVLLGGT